MSIKYYKNNKPSRAAELIADYLPKDKRILFLLAGGSAIELAVLLSEKLPARQSICYSLTDERFGPPGHSDSNWAKLLAAGFRFDKFAYYEVLKGRDMPATVQEYNDFLIGATNKFDVICGLFGMGADGHTAGILPHSAAVVSSQNATGYIADDFTRITITPSFIAKIESAFLFVRGKEKHPQIDKLDMDIEESVQPAQALKLTKSLIVINDYKGEKI